MSLLFRNEPWPQVGAKPGGMRAMCGAIKVAHYKVRSMEEAVKYGVAQTLLLYAMGAVEGHYMD